MTTVRQPFNKAYFHFLSSNREIVWFKLSNTYMWLNFKSLKKKNGIRPASRPVTVSNYGMRKGQYTSKTGANDGRKRKAQFEVSTIYHYKRKTILLA